MTKAELMKLLEPFDDNLTILIPNPDFDNYWVTKEFTVAKSVSQGVNEYDGCLFIDDYEEIDEEVE